MHADGLKMLQITFNQHAAWIQTMLNTVPLTLGSVGSVREMPADSAKGCTVPPLSVKRPAAVQHVICVKDSFAQTVAVNVWAAISLVAAKPSKTGSPPVFSFTLHIRKESLS